MKKLLTTLTALAMLTAVLPATAHAENPDLTELAASLGAYDDHLNYPNISYYTSLPDKDEVNADFTITGYDYASLFPLSEHRLLSENVAKYGDSSFSTSLIEVLVKNGVLKADELISGVNKLSEINFSTNSRKLMDSYQNTLGNSRFKLYYNYLFKSTPSKDKIELLMNKAEKCMNDNRYFLIMYGSYRITPSQAEIESHGSNVSSRVQNVHSAVGIGIADGSWSYNGKSYDKCILTLDSANTDDGNSLFNENTCIYVNSISKETYVPAFSDSLETELHIVAIDDDNILNAEGVNTKPSSVPDLSDIAEITLSDKNDYARYEITGESDGNEFVLNEDNDYLDYYHTPYNGHFFVKADKLIINRRSFALSNLITIKNQDEYFDAELSEADSIIEYDKESYHIYRNYDEELSMFPEDSELHYIVSFENEDASWIFGSDIINDVYYKPVGNKMIIENNGNSFIHDFNYNDNRYDGFYLDGKIMLSFDNDDIPHFLSDIDNDGVFEHEIEKGDVNCDGKIDASDASYILKAYADMSVGINRTINHRLADFNGDNKIDAADASDVLTEYARRATN